MRRQIRRRYKKMSAGEREKASRKAWWHSRAKPIRDELVAAKPLVGSDRTTLFVSFLQRARFQQVVPRTAHAPDEILHRGRGKSSGKVHQVASFQFVARRFVTVLFFSQDVLRLSCRENKNYWQQIIFRASQDSALTKAREIFYCFCTVSGRRARFQLWSWKASSVSAIVTSIEQKWFAAFLAVFVCRRGRKEDPRRKENKIDSVFSDTCWQLKARLGILWKSII